MKKNKIITLLKVVFSLFLIIFCIRCTSKENTIENQEVSKVQPQDTTVKQEVYSERDKRDWMTYPFLYNNYVSDSTQVEYWENYWYKKSGDSSKFIPDTLLMNIYLSPSISLLLDNKKVLGTSSNIKITISFKYGWQQDSYNVVDVQVSDEIVLFDQVVNLEKVYKTIRRENQSYFLEPKPIALKKTLYDLDIYINDKPWEKPFAPYSLNQVIIKTYFSDKNKEVDYTCEFTLPIGGRYNDPNTTGVDNEF